MPGWALIVLAIGAAAAAPPASTIYRCPGAAGETSFSDLPCDGGRVQATQPVITIEMSHPSGAEQTTLERLNRLNNRGAAATRPAAAARPRANVQSPDQRRCEAARDALDQVHAIKRRGYRASSAASLDARQRRYETQRDRNCTRP